MTRAGATPAWSGPDRRQIEDIRGVGQPDRRQRKDTVQAHAERLAELNTGRQRFELAAEPAHFDWHGGKEGRGS